jgi:hypothetical protein
MAWRARGGSGNWLSMASSPDHKSRPNRCNQAPLPGHTGSMASWLSAHHGVDQRGRLVVVSGQTRRHKPPGGFSAHGKRELVTGPGKKAAGKAKAIKGKAKKDTGKVKHKGKKVEHAAKYCPGFWL